VQLKDALSVLDSLDERARVGERSSISRERRLVWSDATQPNGDGNAAIALAIGCFGHDATMGARERLDGLTRALQALSERGRVEVERFGRGQVHDLAEHVSEAVRPIEAAVDRRMGADLVVPRLVDTLLVLVVRRWLEQHPLESAGWLGALRDPKIGHALALIHDAPSYRWTVDGLASKVAMSRAAFARRFVSLVGESPHAYVTRWRMNLAARLLRTTSSSAEQIAAEVGYDSPTAFNGAFRRHLLTSPGRYRNSASKTVSATRSSRGHR
jgi:AraC-like DNA-binding protein